VGEVAASGRANALIDGLTNVKHIISMMDRNFYFFIIFVLLPKQSMIE
jgi:hypothetical protein